MEISIGEMIMEEEVEISALKLDTMKEYPLLENLIVTPSGEEQVFNHPNSYGYDEVRIEAVNLQNKTVEPSLEEQVIIADEGFSGLNEVTVNKVTAELDENLKPENIKEGISIFGVEGSIPNYFTTEKSGKSVFNLYYYMTNLPEYLDVSEYNSLGNFLGSNSFIKKADISKWKYKEDITNAYGFFYECREIEEINMKNWILSNNRDLRQCFSGCYKLKKLEIPDLVCDKVTNIGYFCSNCQQLEYLDLSKFNTLNVTSMQYFCNNCVSLKYLDIRNFVFDNVTQYSSFLYRIPADCMIIVKSEIEKQWVLARRSDLTNIKTVAEYEAS